MRSRKADPDALREQIAKLRMEKKPGYEMEVTRLLKQLERKPKGRYAMT